MEDLNNFPQPFYFAGEMVKTAERLEFLRFSCRMCDLLPVMALIKLN